MEGRRRITLYDQMTAGNSSSRESLASLMLDDVVFHSRNTEAEAEAEAEGSRKLSRNRTLQDIIREDEPNNNNHNNAKDRNKPWKAFKDKLRLKRATVRDNNNSDELTQHNSAQQQQQQNDVVEEDGDNSDLIIQYESPVENPITGGDSSDEENNNDGTAVAGVPLMDLLEETEQEMGLYRATDNDNDNDDDNDVEEYEKEEGEEEKGGVAEYNCCVCMVRHKGAAFIPCGHTFCRMCSREIWVSRGNCPLCNNLILEILDIF
ncbi:hypothetical protein VNO77_08062 [Canavalia gladiata]|uniref:RING-type domain-containing protein n=1 Tax=Canavalia gladiata TaxID=3824 RepID=A0AAN9R0W1_CANGL